MAGVQQPRSRPQLEHRKHTQWSLRQVRELTWETITRWDLCATPTLLLKAPPALKTSRH